MISLPLSFFKWCEQGRIGTGIRESTWMFPVIEAIHLIGLGLVAGSVLVVDLRLLGFGLVRQPADQLADEAEPWLIGSVTLMIATGTLLFLSEATKCYYSWPFWVKMTCLFLVLLFTFTVRRYAIRTKWTAGHPALAKVIALISLGLWFGVGWGGRWIGFN
ncbi:MAG TPA: DUF6644 family protein [Candidatus Aquilonibacter sp.]|nr:DUF6644 family protein [Candidatus Aquilonibacter sp.]